MEATVVSRRCRKCGEDRPHPAEFYTGSAKCKDCSRAERKVARAAMTEEQREALRRANREYKERNPEKVRRINRRAQDRRRERMGDAAFRAYQTAASRQSLTRKRAIIQAARARPCVDCGVEYHLAAMDLHHRNPGDKLFTVSRGVSRREEAILDEIAKCDVLCANCHRIRHHGTC